MGRIEHWRLLLPTDYISYPYQELWLSICKLLGVVRPIASLQI